VNITPEYSLRRIRFCTLAGVEGVRLEGEEISGCFVNQPKRFYGVRGKRLFEEFVNWPTDSKGVLRFTQRFGPLAERPVAGSAFRFRCDHWGGYQEGLRFLWAILQCGSSQPATGSWGSFTGGAFGDVVKFDGVGGWRLVNDASDTWEYVNGALIYNAATLFRFLVLELLAVPHERLRTCARPDCPHRFFVARHLKQNYCSEPCSAWGQRQWKKQWWTEHGTAWRQQRKESKLKKRGGKNVTRKTP